MHKARNVYYSFLNTEIAIFDYKSVQPYFQEAFTYFISYRISEKNQYKVQSEYSVNTKKVKYYQ